MSAERGDKRPGRVAFVGICCIDVILQVPHYPVEDVECSVRQIARRRGGNAANSAVVAAILGNESTFIGSMTTVNADPTSAVAWKDLQEYGVQYLAPTVSREDTTMPVSHIIFNEGTGSRTILHYKDPNFPELSYEQFQATIHSSKLSQGIDWVHFEARNVVQYERMMSELWKWEETQRPLISLELEKDRKEAPVENLLPFANVIFVSKEFCSRRGWDTPELALNSIAKHAPPNGQYWIITWGEKGSYFSYIDKFAEQYELTHVPAVTTSEVVDSVGAGDTFIASFISRLVDGHKSLILNDEIVSDALRKASAIVSEKLKYTGFPKEAISRVADS